MLQIGQQLRGKSLGVLETTLTGVALSQRDFAEIERGMVNGMARPQQAYRSLQVGYGLGALLLVHEVGAPSSLRHFHYACFTYVEAIGAATPLPGIARAMLTQNN
jgi:hypothetical protein